MGTSISVFEQFMGAQFQPVSVAGSLKTFVFCHGHMGHMCGVIMRGSALMFRWVAHFKVAST